MTENPTGQPVAGRRHLEFTRNIIYMYILKIYIKYSFINYRERAYTSVFYTEHIYYMYHISKGLSTSERVVPSSCLSSRHRIALNATFAVDARSRNDGPRMLGGANRETLNSKWDINVHYQLPRSGTAARAEQLTVYRRCI